MDGLGPEREPSSGLGTGYGGQRRGWGGGLPWQRGILMFDSFQTKLTQIEDSYARGKSELTRI